MHGYRISRAATLGATLAIASTLVLGSVTALAGNTRGIEISSKGANPGVLTTTPVSAGSLDVRSQVVLIVEVAI